MLPPRGGKENEEDETFPAKAGLEMKEIIDSTPSLADDLKRLLGGEVRNFSCRLLASGSRMEILDVKFSLIRDAFDDIQGISLVGKQVKDEIKFRALFSLSEKKWRCSNSF